MSADITMVVLAMQAVITVAGIFMGIIIMDMDFTLVRPFSGLPITIGRIITPIILIRLRPSSFDLRHRFTSNNRPVRPLPLKDRMIGNTATTRKVTIRTSRNALPDGKRSRRIPCIKSPAIGITAMTRKDITPTSGNVGRVGSSEHPDEGRLPCSRS